MTSELETLSYGDIVFSEDIYPAELIPYSASIWTEHTVLLADHINNIIDGINQFSNNLIQTENLINELLLRIDAFYNFDAYKPSYLQQFSEDRSIISQKQNTVNSLMSSEIASNKLNAATFHSKIDYLDAFKWNFIGVKTGSSEFDYIGDKLTCDDSNEYCVNKSITKYDINIEKKGNRIFIEKLVIEGEWIIDESGISEIKILQLPCGFNTQKYFTIIKYNTWTSSGVMGIIDGAKQESVSGILEEIIVINADGGVYWKFIGEGACAIRKIEVPKGLYMELQLGL